MVVNAVKYHTALMQLNDDITFIDDRVIRVESLHANEFIVTTNRGTYHCERLVVAAGMYSERYSNL